MSKTVWTHRWDRSKFSFAGRNTVSTEELPQYTTSVRNFSVTNLGWNFRRKKNIHTHTRTDVTNRYVQPTAKLLTALTQTRLSADSPFNSVCLFVNNHVESRSPTRASSNDRIRSTTKTWLSLRIIHNRCCRRRVYSHAICCFVMGSNALW